MSSRGSYLQRSNKRNSTEKFSNQTNDRAPKDSKRVSVEASNKEVSVGSLFGQMIVDGRRLIGSGNTTSLKGNAEAETHEASSSFSAKSRRNGSTTRKPETDISIDPEAALEYLENIKSTLAVRLEKNKIEALASLVPSRIVRYHMTTCESESPTRVFSEKFQAAVLFADISGFSNLAEGLVKEMKHVAYAAENLSRYVGASIEKMVAAIANKGGDVIKFAGDAILAVFPAEKFNGSLEQATLCCSQVALELVEFDFKILTHPRKSGQGKSKGRGQFGSLKVSNRSIASNSTPGQDTETCSDVDDTSGTTSQSPSHFNVKLSVHCGVGCGTIISYHVGGLNDRWEYVVTGPPVEQIGKAETEAGPGETVVSAETRELLRKSLVGEELPSGNLLLSDVNSEPFRDRELIFSELQSLAEDPCKLKHIQDKIRCYVPPPALLSIDSGNGIWSGELRICSTVFCRLVGLRYEGKESDINTIQDSFMVVHKHILAYEGTLLRFIVDDKGAGVLSAFGLPPQKHENDSVRAVKAAMHIIAELKRMCVDQPSWKVRATIGITTGDVFCGTVGGQLRCEYTLHGVKVNMAARLMVSATKDILCDEETFRTSQKFIVYRQPRHIHVKGAKNRVQVFRPKRIILVVIEEKAETRQVGRSAEEGAVKRMLRNVLDPSQPIPQALIITGDAGLGKTRLCNYALHKARRRPFLSLVARGDDTEAHSPFFVWKSLVPQLLQYFVGSTKLSQLSNEERFDLLANRVPESEYLKFLNTDGDLQPDFKDSNMSGFGVGASDDQDINPKRASLPMQYESRYQEPDADHAEARDRVRVLFPMLRRVLPDFFKIDDQVVANEMFNSEVLFSNLVRLLVELFCKAARDLEHAEYYFDVDSNGIRDNNNVIRIVIIVEDVQWADHHSMETLFRLQERMHPIGIMITCRENMLKGSPPTNKIPIAKGSGSSESSGDWYSKIESHSLSTKIELKPLTLEEMRECLKLWIKADGIPNRLIRVVYDKSQGHPFFAYELFKLMVEDGVITVVDGVCQLSNNAQGDDFGLPSTISALMTSRLDRIPAPPQLTLKVAAVIGNEFRLHVLASVLIGYNNLSVQPDNVLRDSSKRKSTSSKISRSTGRSTTNTSSLLDSDLRDIVPSEVDPESSGDSEDEGQPTSVRSERESSASTGTLTATSNSSRMQRSRHDGTSPTAPATVGGDLREISKLLDKNIEYLVQHGFLVSDVNSNGNKVFRFSSVMLRDSAYSLLLFKVRKALHMKVAEFYEVKYHDYLQPVYLRLAHHYFSAEAHEKAMYYLEVAGNDSLEVQSMQAVWLCFTRLISLSSQYRKRTPAWRRASWYRKVGESYMYFAQVNAAEEQLLLGLKELQLEVPDAAQVNERLHLYHAAPPPRRSWFSTLFQRKDQDVASSSEHSHSSSVKGGVWIDLAVEDEEPVEEDKGSGSRRDKSSKQSHSGASGRKPNLLNSPAVRGLPLPLPTFRRMKKEHSEVESEAGSGSSACDSCNSGQRGYSRLKGNEKKEGTVKDNARRRVEEIELMLNSYMRIKETAQFQKIVQDKKSNAEVLTEASRLFSMLTLLRRKLCPKPGPVTLEWGLTATTLAQEALACASSRSDKAKLKAAKSYVFLGGREEKEFGPESEALDELAYCLAESCLFYSSINAKWAREYAVRDYERAAELLPKVRSSFKKGKVSLSLAEYKTRVGEFSEADELVTRASWIFNFMHFHQFKLDSLSIHITLELLRSSDLMPVVRIARNLSEEGLGIKAVSCQSAYIELMVGNYHVALAYLERILGRSLDFLKSRSDNYIRQELADITIQQVATKFPFGLLVLSVYLHRRLGMFDHALLLAKIAGSMLQQFPPYNLPMHFFSGIMAVFRIYMEGFSSFSDSPTETHHRSSVTTLDEPNKLATQLPRTASAKLSRSSLAKSTLELLSDVGTSVIIDNLRNVGSGEVGSIRDMVAFRTYQFHSKSTSEKASKSAEKLKLAFRRNSSPAQIRKQSIGMLEDLGMIMELYSETYPACAPYATFCKAIMQRVLSQKHTKKTRALLEKCATQANAMGMQLLKCTALLELGVARREPVVLERLIPKFKNLHACYEEHRCAYEAQLLRSPK